jgi:hypothetical protein
MNLYTLSKKVQQISKDYYRRERHYPQGVNCKAVYPIDGNVIRIAYYKPASTEDNYKQAGTKGRKKE